MAYIFSGAGLPSILQETKLSPVTVIVMCILSHWGALFHALLQALLRLLPVKLMKIIATEDTVLNSSMLVSRDDA